MNKLKLLLFILVIIELVSCGRATPINTETVGNNVNLQFLFEKDGCKVYRFKDGVIGNVVYITTCPNSQTQHYEKSGKTTVRIENTTVGVN